MNSWRQIRVFLKKNNCYRGLYTGLSCKNIANSNSPGNAKKMEDFFFHHKVQSILRKITGTDYDKVFRRVKQELSTPTFEFVTEKRLKELQDEAKKKAADKLQMPPILDVRKPINEVLTKDPELQGYLEHRLIFADISENTTSQNRTITVRETDGTLRRATWDERARMNQIFFSVKGRSLTVPKLFESPYLDKLLEEGSYLFVLDLACVQFEPDDPLYHGVTSATYEHISKEKRFNELRSTRHFGPMAFYFAWKNNIDDLLQDMIERQLTSDASDTIKMLNFIHSNTFPSLQFDDDDEIIQEFIQKYSKKPSLELAFDTYKEHKLKSEKILLDDVKSYSS